MLSLELDLSKNWFMLVTDCNKSFKFMVTELTKFKFNIIFLF